MANGDIASARGWTTYTSAQARSLGYDNDNYALDRAAEQANRLDNVDKAINQPVFKAGRSTTRIPVSNQTWLVLGANAYATPVLNDGFTSWTGGQLTVAKAGVYRISVHASATQEQSTMAVQVVRNTQTPDTNNTLVKNDSKGAGVTATDLVRLVAGDVLSAMIYMTSNVDKLLNTNAYDLSLSLEWIRA